jgi:hypothetical protein
VTIIAGGVVADVRGFGRLAKEAGSAEILTIAVDVKKLIEIY